MYGYVLHIESPCPSSTVGSAQNLSYMIRLLGEDRLQSEYYIPAHIVQGFVDFHVLLCLMHIHFRSSYKYIVN